MSTTFFDRVPIANGARPTEEFLDLAEVADHFHLPTIQTQDESILDGNDVQQPVISYGETTLSVSDYFRG